MILFKKKQCLKNRQATKIILPFDALSEEIYRPIIARGIACIKDIQQKTSKCFNENQEQNDIKPIMQKSLVFRKQDQIYLLSYHADCKKDDPTVIQTLIKKGFNPCIEDKILHITPYRIAFQRKHERIKDCLRIYNDPYTVPCNKAFYKTSRLTLAIYKGNLKEVKEILEPEEIEINSVKKENKYGMPALCMAAYLGHAHIIKFILENFPLSHKNYPEALHYAAQSGHINILELLIPHYQDVNIKMNPLESTPLHYACENNQIETISYLLKKGANIEAEDMLGNTPLFAAIKNECSEAIKLLINSKANVEYILPGMQHNIIHHLLDYYRNSDPVEIIKHCLNSDIDINAQDLLGNTALFYATQNNHIETIKLLLKRNADKNIANEFNKTPLDIATENENAEIINLLENSQ